MRSFTLKAGLAALVLSVSAAGAFAAQPSAFSSDEAPAVKVMEPRVDVVLQQLQSTVDGIKVEHQDKNLTSAQTAQLDREAAGIRKDVEKIAAGNHGKVPQGDYHQIMARIDSLNVDGKTQPPGNY